MTGRRVCGLAQCTDPHRSGAPVPCTRCRLIYYCSKAHRAEHASHHAPLCNSLSPLKQQLLRQQRGLRGALSEYVGLYWGFYEARDFLRTKMQLMHVYRRIGTNEALVNALEEALDLLRLARADPMAVRYVVPALLLQMDRVQQCYDFVKWWTLALNDETYSFRDMEEPFLDLAGADMAESIRFAEVLSLSHSLAFVVVKLWVQWKLWEGIQADRVGTAKGIPTAVIRTVQDFVGCPFPPHRTVREVHRDVQEQIVEMIKRTHALNGNLWEAVVDAEKKLLNGRTPDGYAAGSKDEVRVTLDVWMDVLDGVRGLGAAIWESEVVVPRHGGHVNGVFSSTKSEH